MVEENGLGILDLLTVAPLFIKNSTTLVFFFLFLLPLVVGVVVLVMD